MPDSKLKEEWRNHWERSFLHLDCTAYIFFRRVRIIA